MKVIHSHFCDTYFGLAGYFVSLIYSRHIDTDSSVFPREEVFWDEAQHTFEVLCDRRECGVLRDLVALPAWIRIIKLLIFSAAGVIWSKVWGGNDESTLMVNAALMVGGTGHLGNEPQLVEV